MAKDPAFLFYTNDFERGVQFFSDEQVGKYLRLLMAQHQHGHLTENQMIHICKSYDKDVFSKFLQDSSGLFYNERLEIEINKRKKFVESRSKNKAGKKHISKSYDNHMENEIENEIEVKDVSFGKSENLLLKIKDFAVEIENSYSKIEAAARRNKTSPDVIKSMIPDFVDVCITKSKDEDTWYNYCNYFSNWLANEFSKQKKSTQTKSPHQLREMNYNEKP